MDLLERMWCGPQQELEMRRLLSSRRELEELQQQVNWIVRSCPALPDFSGFHSLFAQVPQRLRTVSKAPGKEIPIPPPLAAGTLDQPSGDDTEQESYKAYIRDGDVREPFYLSYDEENVEYFTLDEALKRIRQGKELVGSTFIIPYPPGFPIAVPGQVRYIFSW